MNKLQTKNSPQVLTEFIYYSILSYVAPHTCPVCMVNMHRENGILPRLISLACPVCLVNIHQIQVCCLDLLGMLHAIHNWISLSHIVSLLQVTLVCISLVIEMQISNFTNGSNHKSSFFSPSPPPSTDSTQFRNKSKEERKERLQLLHLSLPKFSLEYRCQCTP